MSQECSKKRSIKQLDISVPVLPAHKMGIDARGNHKNLYAGSSKCQHIMTAMPRRLQTTSNGYLHNQKTTSTFLINSGNVEMERIESAKLHPLVIGKG
jgi:hypothetical protein